MIMISEWMIVCGAQVDHPTWKKTVLENFEKIGTTLVQEAVSGIGLLADFSLGKVQFILLDCRYYRDRKEKSMLGTYQKQWP